MVESAAPALGDGILVELLALSADPYMRGGLKVSKTRQLGPELPASEVAGPPPAFYYCCIPTEMYGPTNTFLAA